jgi:hypothetical protein
MRSPSWTSTTEALGLPNERSSRRRKREEYLWCSDESVDPPLSDRRSESAEPSPSGEPTELPASPPAAVMVEPQPDVSAAAANAGTTRQSERAHPRMLARVAVRRRVDAAPVGCHDVEVSFLLYRSAARRSRGRSIRPRNSVPTSGFGSPVSECGLLSRIWTRLLGRVPTTSSAPRELPACLTGRPAPAS